MIQYGATTTNSIWADDPSGAGDTPAYFRKIFTLDSDPVLAQLGGTFFVTDASSVIDDDAQVYLNGALIFDDRLLVTTGLIGLAYRRRRHARAHVTRKRRLDLRGRRRTTSVAAVIAVVLACAAIGRASAATYFTPTQQELLNADDITDLFGGNGSILSATADGDGVLFEIAGGTIDFGKVAARVRGPRDLSAFDGYALHVDIVLAPNPVEVNPFIQTGSNGQLFVQDVPGVKQQGDSFDTVVPFAGVQNIDDVYGFGFQYFTAGDIEAPLAQTVTIRVTPVPEPSAGVLVGAGVCVLAVFRRRGTAAARALP